MAATNACYKNISYWTEDSSDGNIRCGREIWKKKKKEDKGRAGKCEMRKRVGGQDDVSEVNSWEKLRGVRPGKMMMGNGKDL